jgi:hypothetical protein
MRRSDDALFSFQNPENDPFGVDLESKGWILLRAQNSLFVLSLEYSHAISVVEARLVVGMLCYVMISCTVSHGVTFPSILKRNIQNRFGLVRASAIGAPALARLNTMVS